MEKQCRDCGKTLPLSEFYPHKGMKDGHLHKCKVCVKKRIHNYWKDGRGVIVDKRRNQKLARKEWLREQGKRRSRAHANKRRVNNMFYKWFKRNKGVRGVCEICHTTKRVEAHHYDYNKPFDIMWLCSLHHKQWHRENNYISPNNNIDR